MLCEKCGAAISGDDLFEHGGKNYCEDCYIEAATVLKTCDPMAVRAARVTREKTGQQGTEGLLPDQKKIYNYLQKKGKATREQIARELQLEQADLEKHFSVLRHCELVKGLKEGDTIYMTLMDV
ncbi:MAG: ArsR family transcriptional regulator [Firmicutes bacterium]|jgi:predicted HTH transcriptional regulator|nr:ArsR family transcriptional regulator [Bacillota bacterium]